MSLYGAGHPVIKVRGQLMAVDTPLHASTRGGGAASPTSAWIVGGYRASKAIQEEDIKDLAKGVGDFMARTKGP